MIDFGKLYCDLHPNELISNFCLKDTCLVGLCATCICTHTEYHTNNKTVPEYQNIRNTFSCMHEAIRNKINGLETQKNRIDKISEFIQTKRKTIKENVETTRQQTIQAVNKFFQNKQKAMLRELQNEQKKMGLHSQARMESLMNGLSRQTSTLILAAQQLNSLSFLESYQRIKTQTLINAQKLQQQTSRQLDKNQDFQTIIHSNQDYLLGLIRALEQSLNLDFKMNPRTYVSIVTTPIKQLTNNDSGCYLNRAQSNPNFYPIQKQSTRSSQMQQQVVDNNFSAMTFKNVPDVMPQYQLQQSSPKNNTNTNNDDYNQDNFQRRVSGGTAQSIQIQQDNLLTNKNFSQMARPVNFNDSIIEPLTKSQFIREEPQQRMYRQRQQSKQNVNTIISRPQSLNNKNQNHSNQNHQSQILVHQKPYGQQQGAQWGSKNHHYSALCNTIGYQNLTTSQMLNMPSNNQESKLQMRSSNSMIQGNNNGNFNQNNNSKMNFVPQIYDGSQLTKNGDNYNLLSAQNENCKRIRKSGLTLLKMNQSGDSSRSKSNMNNMSNINVNLRANSSQIK